LLETYTKAGVDNLLDETTYTAGNGILISEDNIISNTAVDCTVGTGEAIWVEGKLNTVGDGDQIHAEGLGNTVNANSEAIHIEGAGNSVGNKYNHVEGGGNKVETGTLETNGGTNHVEGGGNTLVEGGSSHIEGAGNTLVEGGSSHIEGGGNKVTGGTTHVEGVANKVVGDTLHVEGNNNTVEGSNTHIEGQYNNVNGEACHIAGFTNTVNGDNSFVYGKNNTAGTNKFIFGHNLNSDDETTKLVIGKWNESKTDNFFEFGIGTGDNDRKNILEINNNDEIYYRYNGVMTQLTPPQTPSQTGCKMCNGYQTKEHTITEEEISNKRFEVLFDNEEVLNRVGNFSNGIVYWLFEVYHNNDQGDCKFHCDIDKISVTGGSASRNIGNLYIPKLPGRVTTFTFNLTEDLRRDWVKEGPEFSSIASGFSKDNKIEITRYYYIIAV